MRECTMRSYRAELIDAILLVVKDPEHDDECWVSLLAECDVDLAGKEQLVSSLPLEEHENDNACVIPAAFAKYAVFTAYPRTARTTFDACGMSNPSASFAPSVEELTTRVGGSLSKCSFTVRVTITFSSL